LTDSAIEVPKFKPSDEIPVTYVPARNTIFLSYAMRLPFSSSHFLRSEARFLLSNISII
jgi:7-cyano-7-deazaguanine synthase in queuosine biosynthesis